jgi:hypothetical protein
VERRDRAAALSLITQHNTSNVMPGAPAPEARAVRRATAQ